MNGVRAGVNGKRAGELATAKQAGVPRATLEPKNHRRDRPRHRRVPVQRLNQVLIDWLAWAVAVVFASAVRLDFALSRVDVRGVGVAIIVACGGQLVAGLASGLYRGRWRFGSFDEITALVPSALFGTALLATVAGVGPPSIAFSTTLAAGVTALVLMAGTRYTGRAMREHRRRPCPIGSERLLVFGAGEGGTQAVSAMVRNPASPFLPVALLDDDPEKRNLKIMGVPVAGTRDDIALVARRFKAQTLLVAIPSAGASLIGELGALATRAGLVVKVLPPVKELFGSRISMSDIRDVAPGDLLGRQEVEIDVASIAGYLTGRRVLVTGAGGFIGSELCRQIDRFGPSELILLDRDESGLHGVQLSLDGRGLLDSSDLVLLDIRDGQALHDLIMRRRPDVVFHAAALKHLPLLELHPAEAVKTNVIATLNLLNAVSLAGVERFVNISTDKAADPESVLGYSKRITERLTSYFSSQAAGSTYLSVRFGNVLGSRGSVLSTFRAQIAVGGPLTVTHREATRYFMTVEEAIQLLIQAGADGGNGEVLVLDMGPPVSIADVARRLTATADWPIEIIYTGLRTGEKLHEARLGRDEVDRRPTHPLISHVDVTALDPRRVHVLERLSDNAEIIAALATLADEPISEALPQGAQ